VPVQTNGIEVILSGPATQFHLRDENGTWRI